MSNIWSDILLLALLLIINFQIFRLEERISTTRCELMNEIDYLKARMQGDIYKLYREIQRENEKDKE